MAQVSSALDGRAELYTRPINRIALPFLRIQERKWLLAAIDVFLAAGWMIGADALWRLLAKPGAHNMVGTPWAWVGGSALAWLCISWLAGAYELDTADHFVSAARVTVIVGFVATLVAFVAYYVFLKTYPRPALTLDLVAVPLSVILWRATYAAVLRRPASATRLVVVGDCGSWEALVGAAALHPSYYRVVGFVSNVASSHGACLGDVTQLDAVIRHRRIHRIVVAPGFQLSPDIVAMLSWWLQCGVEVMDFHTTYEAIAGKVAVEQADGQWLLPISANVSQLEDVAMRIVDVLGALAGLALTILVGPLIALSILLESGFPVIYRQTRLGRTGHPFTIYKFRSMGSDAEAAGARWAEREDLRVTRIGRLLRRTHLDELPQFWNIVRGEMSLVGPRPERPVFTESLSRQIPFYALRLSVRPGLTGLKQIRVGYAGSIDEHLEVLRHDLYYIKHRSLGLNILIIARTLGSVFGMDGR